MLILENSIELKFTYIEIVIQGDLRVSIDTKDKINFYFMCFVKLLINKYIYKLNNDRKDPIDKKVLVEPSKDFLCEIL